MGKLFEKLTEYSESDFYPYHMPGHKRQTVGNLPQAWTAVDITEIDGFDNLHQAEGILKELQEEAARAYGAEESFYLINGSTCGILSAVSAAVPFGGELLISRNCHKSVYHGAYLRHLKLDYIYPEVLEDFDICEAVTAKQVEEALREHPQAEAVLIVSPTYEGRIADVRAIAEVVHAQGLPLIVDEAHGAHLGFSEAFAQNSCRLGADLVINSVHKTLPAMTQTALLHCNGDRIDRERLRRFLHIYQSSSPSYVLMASIEEAVKAAREQSEAFRIFAQRWKTLLETLSGCRYLRFLPVSYDECAKKTQDIGKLIISVKGTGLSGQELYDILLSKYHLQMEMACESYVLAMFTMGDTEEGYERLGKALLEIDVGLREEDVRKTDAPGVDVTKQVKKGYVALQQTVEIPYYIAWDRKKECISLQEAEGRVAGEFINIYPPGTPIVVPGERISKEVIDVINCYLEAGLAVQGVSSKRCINVLKNN